MEGRTALVDVQVSGTILLVVGALGLAALLLTIAAAAVRGRRGSPLRIAPALLMSFVFLLSATCLAVGALISYTPGLGSVYGVDVPSLGTSLMALGTAGYLLFVALLGAWAVRRGRGRGTTAGREAG